MKKLLAIILVSLLLVPIALADDVLFQEYEPDTEITYEFARDEFDRIVLQEADLLDENICNTLYAIIHDDVGADEYVKSIKLSNGSLTVTIYIPESDDEYFTVGMLGQMRTSSITDAILNYEELDVYWETINIVIDGYTTAIFTKDDVQMDKYGNMLIRYIKSETINSQIPE